MVDDQALGLLETRGLIGAIEAADAMVKAADVRLLAIEQTVAALMTVKVTGETAAVQSAVDAGRAAAERVGTVVSTHVIPRPAESTRALVADETDDRAPRGTRSSQPVGKMTVRALRQLARDTPDFPIQGRAIASATKSELVALFKQIGRG